ncbi:MAG: hypothetical protein KIT08_01505 [Anaerolineales bacterium]|nr:MAG: hypothetical protein KIT08_01505 [Anaerolineales bacterium]
MDSVAQFFAVISEQLHIKVLKPQMKLRYRFVWSLLVAPAIALLSYLEKGRWVSASTIGSWWGMGLVVTYAIHLSMEWRNRRVAKDAERRIEDYAK